MGVPVHVGVPEHGNTAWVPAWVSLQVLWVSLRWVSPRMAQSLRFDLRTARVSPRTVLPDPLRIDSHPRCCMVFPPTHQEGVGWICHGCPRPH